MRCKNPYSPHTGFVFPCGVCLPCKINAKRIWQHRILIEAEKHCSNSFITLTYEDKNLPPDSGLSVRDYQLWLKRFRKAVHPVALRFFLCGEYGDQTFRPHYHAAIFGYPSCMHGKTRYNQGYRDCCEVCDLVRDTWGYGLVDVGTLTKDSAAYVAGYVTKKMTRKDDPRLAGRHPEFGRMSLRPGIGAVGIPDISALLTEGPGRHIIDATGDIPTTLMSGGKLLPLGRYLRRKLREEIQSKGIEVSSERALSDHVEKLLTLYKNSFNDPRFKNLSFKDFMIESNRGKVASIEGRAKIFSQRRTL